MLDFQYSLPAETPSPSPLEGLSDQARSTLTHVVMGPSAAHVLLDPPEGDGGSGGGELAGLTPDVESWARAGINEALVKWSKYTHLFPNDSPLPLTIDQLADESLRLSPTLTRLFEAQTTFRGLAWETPEGHNFGETMKLGIVPWRLFRDSLHDESKFKAVLGAIRREQGITTEDYINSDLMATIRNNGGLYRMKANPSVTMSAATYLDEKILEDGDWGVMLVQTSEQAGLKDQIGQDPDQLTSNGTGNLSIGNYNVDALGIFEWLALTAQEDPRQLSGTTDYSWMLANRLDVNGAALVPFGYWRGRVRSDLSWAYNQRGLIRPRLAVM